VMFNHGRYELMPRSMDDLDFNGDPIIVENDQPDVIGGDISETPYTIYEIQTMTESVDCTTDGFVNVFDGAAFAPVVVTTPKFSASADLDGYYIEDWPLADNREFHGISVVVDKDLSTAFVPGDVITISNGKYYEYYCMSQLKMNVAATKDSTEDAPAPVSVPLSLLKNGGLDNTAEAEKYEGLLVTIPETTVTAATSSDANSWFEVGNGIHISNKFYIQDITPVADATVSSVTGVVLYHHGKYRLAPRTAADIVFSAK
ncbi:hypothetical protein KAH55_12865, partial [bacterium]|nr:hypothetical protein [bacterium]